MAEREGDTMAVALTANGMPIVAHVNTFEMRITAHGVHKSR